MTGGRWPNVQPCSGTDDRAPAFEQDDIPPGAASVAADPFLDADPAEPGPLVEGKARHIFRLDTGDQRPHAGSFGCRDQDLEQGEPDAAATS